MPSRRTLLKAAAAPFACAGFSAMLSGFPARAANATGYRALVCVFLFGGLDNHDTVLPYDQPSYDRYAQIRSSLLDFYRRRPDGSTRDRGALMPIAPLNAGDFPGRVFALPPELAPLHALFDRGNAAIVGNVGPLIEPIDAAGFAAGGAPTPSRLFSHNDQQSTWMAFAPEGAQFGWGGRFADIASGANDETMFSGISLAGNQVFLSGGETGSYEASPNGAVGVEILNGPTVGGRRELRAVLRDHFRADGQSPANLFEQDVVAVTRRSIEANDVFNAALADGVPVSTVFPESNLGRQLRAVADAIAVREALGARRQIFFVSRGGFDTHSGQAPVLPDLQRDVARSMAAFHEATVELGVSFDVTAFTASDFGRALAINGDGTDHGWGGHHFVVGGAVRGGRIYGALPPYEFGHKLDAGGGRLIPSVSVEQYAAGLGGWFGLSDAELNAALPLLGNFPDGPLALF